MNNFDCWQIHQQSLYRNINFKMQLIVFVICVLWRFQHSSKHGLKTESIIYLLLNRYKNIINIIRKMSVSSIVSVYFEPSLFVPTHICWQVETYVEAYRVFIILFCHAIDCETSNPGTILHMSNLQQEKLKLIELLIQFTVSSQSSFIYKYNR